MRISGTEPSSVILSQTKKFKSWKVMPKMPEQAEAKRDVVIWVYSIWDIGRTSHVSNRFSFCYYGIKKEIDKQMPRHATSPYQINRCGVDTGGC